MSEQEPETTGDESAEASPGADGLDDLQESHLDSVTGGGDGPEPIMDLQGAEPDRVEKSEDRGALETKEARDEDAGEGAR